MPSVLVLFFVRGGYCSRVQLSFSRNGGPASPPPKELLGLSRLPDFLRVLLFTFPPFSLPAPPSPPLQAIWWLTVIDFPLPVPGPGCTTGMIFLSSLLSEPPLGGGDEFWLPSPLFVASRLQRVFDGTGGLRSFFFSEGLFPGLPPPPLH